MRQVFGTVAVVTVLVVSGCTSAEDGETSSAGASPGEAAVDPQVLQDVAAWALRAPGPSVRRAQRVDNFMKAWSIRQCGGVPLIALDSTAHRVEQQGFPDLEVIREKTLTEPEPIAEPGTGRRGCDGASKGNILDKMPTSDAAGNLGMPWDDVVATAEQDERLIALKAPMAQCLREGWPSVAKSITDADPALTYLKAIDFEIIKSGERLKKRTAREQAVLYVECGTDYFGRLQELLEAERPAMIERNREVLERFASELVAVGYVP